MQEIDLHNKDEPIMHQLLSSLVLIYYYLIGVVRGYRNHVYARKKFIKVKVVLVAGDLCIYY